MKKLVILLASASLLGAASLPLAAADAASTDEGATTVKGEIVDLACYLDHGAQGEKHAGCAQKCISSGLPVGIKTDDGKLYLVIGEHKPMNDELAQYAAQTITLKGKVRSRDGVNLLENAEIVK